MFKPWSTIDNEELKWLRSIKDQVLKLKRGCDCTYEHGLCNRCRALSDLQELASK